MTRVLLEDCQLKDKQPNQMHSMRQIFRNEKDIIAKLPTKRLQKDQMQPRGFAPRQAPCLTSNLLGVGRGNLTSLEA